MKFNIKYSNDTPPFEQDLGKTKGWGVPIMEIKIAGNDNRTKKAALNDYLINFVYAFRYLINKHETDISELKISDWEQNFMNLTIHKIENDITIEDENGFEITEQSFFPYNCIVFTFYSDFFNEQLYFTRNGDVLSEASTDYHGNNLNSIILDKSNTKSEEESRKFLLSLLTAITEYLPDYTVDFNEEEGKLEYSYKGELIEDLDEIKEDDVFVFFKLIEVILCRSYNTGVFFLDCSLISPPVVNALVLFINLYYLKARTIFLYNVPSDRRNALKNITRETLILPNHKSNNNKDVKSKGKKK